MREIEIGRDNRSYGEIQRINGMIEFKDFSKQHKKPVTTRFHTQDQLDRYLLKTKKIDTWEIKEVASNNIIYKHKTLGDIETFSSEQDLNRSLAKENNGAWKVAYRAKQKNLHNHFILAKSGWLTHEYKRFSLVQASDFSKEVSEEELHATHTQQWLGLGLLSVAGLANWIIQLASSNENKQDCTANLIDPESTDNFYLNESEHQPAIVIPALLSKVPSTSFSLALNLVTYQFSHRSAFTGLALICLQMGVSEVKAQVLPAIVDLHTATALDRTVFYGSLANSQMGAVTSIGDVNGDKKADFLIGVNEASTSGRDHAGRSYLIYGKNNFPGELVLNSLTPDQGMVIVGARQNDYSGKEVSDAGDVNGDGRVDFLISAEHASPYERLYAGAVYLFYGSSSFPASFDLANFASEGMLMQGAAAGDWTGVSTSAAGDVNGDGIDDVLVGAAKASFRGRLEAGCTYLIYGSNSSLPRILDLSRLTPAQGVKIYGAAANEQSGISVSGLRDVNNDGKAEFLIGAHNASSLNRTRTEAGRTYLLYGASNLPGTVDLAALTSTQGLIIEGAMAGDNSGTSVSRARDVDGDGKEDILIGAQNANVPGRVGAGRVYLLYSRNLPNKALDLADLTPTQGMVIQGAAAGDHVGHAVSDAGDINGDGKGDLLVSSHAASTPQKAQAGCTYLVFGGSSLQGELDLNNFTPTDGVKIKGADPGDHSGTSISDAGDVNGDGKPDILIGASQASPHGVSKAGNVYVIYGDYPPTPLPTQAPTSFPTPAPTIPPLTCLPLPGNANVYDLQNLTVSQRGETEVATTGYVSLNDNVAIQRRYRFNLAQYSTSAVDFNVAILGKFNMDNYADFAVACAQENKNGADSGLVYVMHGRSDIVSTMAISVGTSSGYDSLYYGKAGWRLGSTMSAVGDVNKDGYDDMVVTTNPTQQAQTNGAKPTAYLLYGGNPAQSVDLSGGILATNIGVEISLPNCATDNLKISVAGIGDVNRDGYADIGFGFPAMSDEGRFNAGAAMVLYGAENLPSKIDLSNIDKTIPGVRTAVFKGQASYDLTGISIAGLKDVDGDEIDDFVVGAPQYVQGIREDSYGKIYIIKGLNRQYYTPPITSLSMTMPQSIIQITGEDKNAQFGYRVFAAGKVNDDDVADIGVSAWNASTTDQMNQLQAQAGKAYIIFGSSAGLTSFGVGVLNDDRGRRIVGGYAADTLGGSVRNIGDVDKDGTNDLIVATQNSGNFANRPVHSTYLMLGKKLRQALATVKANDVVRTEFGEGFKYREQNGYENQEFVITEVGDLNGDGKAEEFIIASLGVKQDVAASGSSYAFEAGARVVNGSALSPKPATSIAPSITTTNLTPSVSTTLSMSSSVSSALTTISGTSTVSSTTTHTQSGSTFVPPVILTATASASTQANSGSNAAVLGGAIGGPLGTVAAAAIGAGVAYWKNKKFRAFIDDKLKGDKTATDTYERARQEAQRREDQERREQEQERQEQERQEQERHAQERLEQERLEQERLEQERLEQERLEQERLEQERLEQERLEQERLEQERQRQAVPLADLHVEEGLIGAAVPSTNDYQGQPIRKKRSSKTNRTETTPGVEMFQRQHRHRKSSRSASHHTHHSSGESQQVIPEPTLNGSNNQIPTTASFQR